MAIRLDDQRQVAPGQAPGQYSAPNNQGGAIASRQTAGLGQQVARAADAVADVFVVELEKANKARVTEALTKAQVAAREYELDARQFKGGNAFSGQFEDKPLPDFYTGRLDEDLSEIEAGLTPVQVAAFRERVTPVRENTRLALEEHTQREGLAYQEQSHTAYTLEGVRAVEQGWQSPTLMATGLETIAQGVTNLAALRGLPPEAVEIEIEKQQSGALLGAISSAATEENGDAVEQLWQAYAPQLTREDREAASRLRAPVADRRITGTALSRVFDPASRPTGWGERQEGGPLDFNVAVEQVLVHEGGYSNDPQDPGGETNFGISKNAHPEAWADGRVTREEAIAIYRKDYWDRNRLDEQPADVARVMFDIVVNQGQDGLEDILEQAGPNPTAERLTELRIERYRRTRNFDRFGRGWLRRAEDVLGEAIEAGRSGPSVEPPPARAPVSATEAADFSRRAALIEGATPRQADLAADAGRRQFEGAEREKKAAEDRAVETAYEYARRNGIYSFDELPDAMQAAVPVDRHGTIDGHLKNLDPAVLRDTPPAVFIATRSDDFVADLFRPGNDEALMGVLTQMSASDQRELLTRGAQLTGRDVAGASAQAEWQKLPQGWVGEIDRHAADLGLETEDKAVVSRVTQRAIWVEQERLGRSLTPVETTELVAKVVNQRMLTADLPTPYAPAADGSRRAPQNNGSRLATAPLRAYPRAQVEGVRQELRQRTGQEPNDGDVEVELYLRAVYGGARVGARY